MQLSPDRIKQTLKAPAVIDGEFAFDEDFLLDRLAECLSICSFQERRSFENEDLFHFSYEQAQHWLNRYELLLGADSHTVILIKSKLAILRAGFVHHEILLELESEETGSAR